MQARAAVLTMAVLTASCANAADVKVLATTAMKAALDALAPRFARDTAHTPRIAYGPSGALAKRVADGEAGDLVILAGGIDELIRQGRVVPASRTDVARARIGVAVRKGAPKPDISSPEAFRRALLAARSVAFAGPASGGASGVYLVGMLERLGVNTRDQVSKLETKNIAAVMVTATLPTAIGAFSFSPFRIPAMKFAK